MSNKLRIGITVGDFNGVGPELILKTLNNDLVFNYCTPVVYGNVFVFNFYTNLLESAKMDFNIVRRPKDIKEGVVNLRVCSDDRIDVTPGEASEQAGKFAFDALALAIKDIKEGLIQNLLTAPIDKNSIVQAGFEFNGHTDYLGQQFESEPLMMLLNDNLRVAMVTSHTALENVAISLTQEKVFNTIARVNDALISDFNIPKPKIAVLGLNPHSGDHGLMGNQEQEFIIPAIKKASDEGILAVGPYPADGFFGSRQAAAFNAVVGMYHDQVLAPFKQVAFSEGVNYTAGLPIVRTSPDHGTAYDIAGKGEVDIASFVNALYLINKIHRNRIEFFDLSKNQLYFKDHRREKFSIGVPVLN